MQLIIDSRDSSEELAIAREFIERLQNIKPEKPADIPPPLAEPDPMKVFGDNAAAPAPDPAKVFGDNAAIPLPPAVTALYEGLAELLPTPTQTELALAAAQVPPPPPDMSAASVEVDAENLPWDARIHAGTKTKLKGTGIWKLARGVDPALVAQVKAEWRKLYPAPQPKAVPTSEAPAPGSVPLPPPIGAASASVPLPPVTSNTVGSPGATATTVSLSDNPTTFVEIVRNATHYLGAGKLTKESLKAALATVEVAELPMLAARVDLIPAAWAAIATLITP